MYAVNEKERWWNNFGSLLISLKLFPVIEGINSYVLHNKWQAKVGKILFTHSLRSQIELLAKTFPVSNKCSRKVDESNFCVGAQRRVSYENYAPFERSEKLRS